MKEERIIMFESELTQRQQREKEYYETFAERLEEVDVCFDSILRKEKRPWNPYWFIYEAALQNFKSNRQKLLDFGCGNGSRSIVFGKIGYDVYGFDISQRNIETAKNLSKKYRLEHKIHLSVQVAEKLNYQPNCFDLVVGVDILHHLNLEKSLRECFRLLKKEGMAIFREPIEVPIFDAIRNSKLGRLLVPKDKSFVRHITEDERKLTMKDIKLIENVFPNTKIYNFTLLSRIDPFIRNQGDKKPSMLEKIDYALFKLFPSLSKLGGSLVLVLKK